MKSEKEKLIKERNDLLVRVVDFENKKDQAIEEGHVLFASEVEIEKQLKETEEQILARNREMKAKEDEIEKMKVAHNDTIAMFVKIVTDLKSEIERDLIIMKKRTLLTK